MSYLKIKKIVETDVNRGLNKSGELQTSL